ncbi:MAG: glycosyltransferase family 2 protein [Cyclobacteriaceae bacterium]|nr:glycosyltransferase family 2 protein [Cyclobacteriaceae bacterium]
MWIIELIIIIYFIYIVLYTCVFAIAGLFYKLPSKIDSNEKKKFCVLIPCYKEDVVILDVAKKALEQSYPSEYYDVVIIADSLQPKTINALQQLPLKVVEVQFENSTKVKSLNFALQSLPSNYDYAVILDADNVMKYDFLEIINGTLSPSIKAIQGQRQPKNQNNSLAILDGVSEAINNHIYRQGTVSLGLSSSISGSGVVFSFETLKEKLSTMSSIGGFDRELELLLLKDGITVNYHLDAIIYDEKVSQSKTFQNQRKRWISSQYFYLKKYFREGMVALLKGDFKFFNSSVLRNIQLPRLINIGLLTVLTFGLFFLKDHLFFGYLIWISLFIINTFSILISIPKDFYNKKLLQAIFRLPGIFINMVLLLFKLQGANKKFIHTPHGVAGTQQDKISK